MTQRAAALKPPITTSTADGSVKRGDSANSTISASTPSDHSAAMVSPPRPACFQTMEAKM
jgi:hypothetical protein